MKLSLNAAVDVLPHNANLHLWKKRQDLACPLCDNNKSLLHVLNNCAVARELQRYNFRDEKLLQPSYISQSSVLSIDIHDNYEFPLHIDL